MDCLARPPGLRRLAATSAVAVLLASPAIALTCLDVSQLQMSSGRRASGAVSVETFSRKHPELALNQHFCLDTIADTSSNAQIRLYASDKAPETICTDKLLQGWIPPPQGSFHRNQSSDPRILWDDGPSYKADVHCTVPESKIKAIFGPPIVTQKFSTQKKHERVVLSLLDWKQQPRSPERTHLALCLSQAPTICAIIYENEHNPNISGVVEHQPPFAIIDSAIMEDRNQSLSIRFTPSQNTACNVLPPTIWLSNKHGIFNHRAHMGIPIWPFHNETCVEKSTSVISIPIHSIIRKWPSKSFEHFSEDDDTRNGEYQLDLQRALSSTHVSVGDGSFVAIERQTTDWSCFSLTLSELSLTRADILVQIQCPVNISAVLSLFWEEMMYKPRTLKFLGQMRLNTHSTQITQVKVSIVRDSKRQVGKLIGVLKSPSVPSKKFYLSNVLRQTSDLINRYQPIKYLAFEDLDLSSDRIRGVLEFDIHELCQSIRIKTPIIQIAVFLPQTLKKHSVGHISAAPWVREKVACDSSGVLSVHLDRLLSLNGLELVDVVVRVASSESDGGGILIVDDEVNDALVLVGQIRNRIRPSLVTLNQLMSLERRGDMHHFAIRERMTQTIGLSGGNMLISELSNDAGKASFSDFLAIPSPMSEGTIKFNLIYGSEEFEIQENIPSNRIRIGLTAVDVDPTPGSVRLVGSVFVFRRKVDGVSFETVRLMGVFRRETSPLDDDIEVVLLREIACFDDRDSDEIKSARLDLDIPFVRNLNGIGDWSIIGIKAEIKENGVVIATSNIENVFDWADFEQVFVNEHEDVMIAGGDPLHVSSIEVTVVSNQAALTPRLKNFCQQICMHRRDCMHVSVIEADKQIDGGDLYLTFLRHCRLYDKAFDGMFRHPNSTVYDRSQFQTGVSLKPSTCLFRQDDQFSCTLTTQHGHYYYRNSASCGFNQDQFGFSYLSVCPSANQDLPSSNELIISGSSTSNFKLAKTHVSQTWFGQITKSPSSIKIHVIARIKTGNNETSETAALSNGNLSPNKWLMLVESDSIHWAINLAFEHQNVSSMQNVTVPLWELSDRRSMSVGLFVIDAVGPTIALRDANVMNANGVKNVLQ